MCIRRRLACAAVVFAMVFSAVAMFANTALAAGEKRAASFDAVSAETNVYLTSFESVTPVVTLNDSAHFTLSGTTVNIRTSGNWSTSNPFSVRWNNIGYTTAGDAVDVVMDVTSYRLTNDYEMNDNSAFYIGGSGWHAGEPILPALGSGSREMTVKFHVYRRGTNTEVPGATYLVCVEDIDTTDYGSGERTWAGYAEGVRLDGNYDSSNIWISSHSCLNIGSDGGRPTYVGTIATNEDGSEAGYTEWDSGVAIKAQQGFTMTHRISSGASAVGLKSNFKTYPTLEAPVKSPESQQGVLGENVTFSVTQRFPYVTDSNKARSATFSDTLDDAFDASATTIAVKKGSVDVTSSGGWSLSRSGQTVSVTTTNCGHGVLEGDYTFVVLTKLRPSADVSSRPISGNDRILKNKASVSVVSQQSTTQTKTSNEVELRLHRSLTIRKDTVGIGAELGRPFSFSISIKNGQNTWKSETFTLANGQTKVYAEVPVGCTWSVDETAYSRYATTWTNKTGTVGASNVVVVARNERRLSSVVVSKQVPDSDNISAWSGTVAPDYRSHDVFSFEIVVTGDDNGSQYEFLRQTFTLLAGESKTFDNIPSEFSYVVRETGGAEHYEITATGDSGTLVADVASRTTFINVRHGWLDVSKITTI